MLRMTKLADYGFVLLIHMALMDRSQWHNARDLSNATRLPLPMVSKILKALARGGLLTSTRGTKGGYRLARDPAEINAAEVITALDGPISITECLDAGDSSCNVEMLCPVKVSWQRVNHAIQDALEEITLAEMISPLNFGERCESNETAEQSVVQ